MCALCCSSALSRTIPERRKISVKIISVPTPLLLTAGRMVNANSKEKVLELVARQLMYYELDDIAEKVAEHLTPHPNLAKLSASNQLADCVRQTLSVPGRLNAL